MNKSIILKKLYGDEILKTGFALDLGFGAAREVIDLAESGYDVDAVDINAENVEGLNKLITEKNLTKVHVFNQKMQDFIIEKEKYTCIIASNSLPFIDSKETAIEVIENIVNGLKKDGCMYITLFGTKDAWADKPTMSFFEYSEIKTLLDSLNIKFYQSVIEEGFGKTMKGDIKYWNVFKFIYIKK